MSLQVEKLEGNMARLTIEASAEDFEQAIEKAYQKNKNKLSIPGFRKGKVPRKMIEQMYGKEIFYGEVRESEKDFYRTKHIYAVGELAFLFDSIQPQAKYQNKTARQLLEIWLFPLKNL